MDDPIACNLCHMWLNGLDQYQDHLEGKIHRKNMREQMNKHQEQGRSAVDSICQPPEGSGSAESGAQAAAPAAAAPVVPKGAAKSEPIELPETLPAGKTELNRKEVLTLIEDEVDQMGRA